MYFPLGIHFILPQFIHALLTVILSNTGLKYLAACCIADIPHIFIRIHSVCNRQTQLSFRKKHIDGLRILSL